MVEEKYFPEEMNPLGNQSFQFHCHAGVSCFTLCCRDVDLDLYPYDIVRLKQRLSLDSEKFLESYTRIAPGGNPFFPAVKLKLVHDGSGYACPFLTKEGCSVYSDRPSGCRTYPLERAIDREHRRGRCREWYFMTNNSYCRGHREGRSFTVRQWVRNQQLEQYNVMNDLWSTVDTFLAQNPFKGEGSGGPRQQLVFLACYNLDGFRRYMEEYRLLDGASLARERKRRIKKSDEELLKFAFEWVIDALR